MRFGRRSFLSAAGVSIVVPAQAADLDVVIVGAGIAGLVAARTLIAAGRSVLVVEGRNRIGGRAFTDSSLGFPFDSGAEWFDPEGVVARELIGTLTPGPSQRVIAVAGNVLDAEQSGRFDKTMAEMVQKVREHRASEIKTNDGLENLAYMEMMQKPPFDLSARFGGGLGAAIAQYGNNVPVKLSTRVLRIDSTAPLIDIKTSEGSLRAKTAIVTVPMTMLTASHDMLRPELASKRQGYLDFVPPLDAKRQEVIKFGLLGSYLKVALTFSNGHPRWPANVWVMGYDGRANFFDILMRPDNRDAAIVCLAGLDALVLDYDVNETRSFALEKVAQFYGSDIRAALVGATVTHWSQDPFALGAWAIGSGSYWVRGEERLAKIYATPHHDRVFFAGDATDTDTFAIGRVEGAWASGLRAAQEALAFLPKG